MFTEESDDEDERPSRRRRIAERAAEGAEDEEVYTFSLILSPMASVINLMVTSQGNFKHSVIGFHFCMQGANFAY